MRALGDSGARVCLCRTTERDLGDGLPRTRDLVRAGVPPERLSELVYAFDEAPYEAVREPAG